MPIMFISLLPGMLAAVKAGHIIMDGAPEFGGQFGGFMLEIGALAK